MASKASQLDILTFSNYNQSHNINGCDSFKIKSLKIKTKDVDINKGCALQLLTNSIPIFSIDFKLLYMLCEFEIENDTTYIIIPKWLMLDKSEFKSNEIPIYLSSFTITISNVSSNLDLVIVKKYYDKKITNAKTNFSIIVNQFISYNFDSSYIPLYCFKNITGFFIKANKIEEIEFSIEGYTFFRYNDDIISQVGNIMKIDHETYFYWIPIQPYKKCNTTKTTRITKGNLEFFNNYQCGTIYILEKKELLFSKNSCMYRYVN